MKLKKIVVAGAKAAFGIRMVKESTSLACTPKISGLFLQGDDLEWTLTEKEISLSTDMYSFLPIRLVGETCGDEVIWSTSWQPGGYDGTPPVFFGAGPLGIVGWSMMYSWGNWFSVGVQAGLLTVSAACAGTTFGPVEIMFTGGGYYR